MGLVLFLVFLYILCFDDDLRFNTMFRSFTRCLECDLIVKTSIFASSFFPSLFDCDNSHSANHLPNGAVENAVEPKKV